MVKRRSVTCLVALALLGCLVEAQTYGTAWGSQQDPRLPSAPTPGKTAPKRPGGEWRRPPRPRDPPARKQPPKQHGTSWRPQDPVVPVLPPPGPPMRTTQQLAHPTPVQSCDVAHQLRVPCGLAAITAEDCSTISCCHDGDGCYFGRTVTVQCTKDAQFIVVVARDVTLPNIDLESITVMAQGQGCAHVDSNSAFAIYQFPVTDCGTAVMEEPGVIIYENRMSSRYEVANGPFGTITRDSTFELLFQCRYTATSVETLLVRIFPLGDNPQPPPGFGPLHLELRLANGVCRTKGCVEEEAAYGSYYADADYPVTKVLRDPVYVEVRIVGKTDPNLVLNLGRCWTTINPNPHSLPQWDLLIDGCPYEDDNHLSTIIPTSGVNFLTHYKRFSFKMFTFVDPTSRVLLREQVYIHCSTVVCLPEPGISCDHSCDHFRGKRDVSEKTTSERKPRPVISSRPMVMVPPAE